MKRSLTLSLMLLALVACQASTDEEIKFNKQMGLKPMQSCSELNTHLRNNMLEKMNQELDEMLENPYCPVFDYMADVVPVATAPGSSEDSGTVDFTETNVQELGVDESDLIKTDGQHVYALSQGKLSIIRVWPFSQFGKIGTFPLTGTPKGIYLKGDTVVILESMTSYKNQIPSALASANAGQQYIDYGDYIKVTLVDVSSPEYPAMLKESYYTGLLQADRRVEDRVHLVVSTSMAYPSLQYYVSDASVPGCGVPETEENIQKYKQAVEKLRAKNTQAINAFDFTQNKTLMAYRQSSEANFKTKSLSCSDFFASQVGNAYSALHLITTNIDESASEDQVASVVGTGGTVYASPRALYIADEIYAEDQTVIHRFGLTQSPSYTGSNLIEGHVLNPYSMSEYQGILRVATTKGQVFNSGGNTAANAVYTLNALSSDLEILGSVGDLAKGEEIYSVRFIGPKGYVVTFKKVDPLFVIDLEDPGSPGVLGELKVPGFSTYLHPLDEDHLIGFGKDAEDVGDFAWFQGLKLSLFDVADSTLPSEVDSLIMGGRGSSSEALWDPHAFTYDASQGLLALPVGIHDQTAGGSQYGDFLYSGLHLLALDSNGGITLVGVLKLDEESDAYHANQVRRSLFLGNENTKGLVVLSSEGVSLHKLDETLSTLASVNL